MKQPSLDKLVRNSVELAFTTRQLLKADEWFLKDAISRLLNLTTHDPGRIWDILQDLSVRCDCIPKFVFRTCMVSNMEIPMCLCATRCETMVKFLPFRRNIWSTGVVKRAPKVITLRGEAFAKELLPVILHNRPVPSTFPSSVRAICSDASTNAWQKVRMCTQDIYPKSNVVEGKRSIWVAP